jgi:hypothetical protein
MIWEKDCRNSNQQKSKKRLWQTTIFHTVIKSISWLYLQKEMNLVDSIGRTEIINIF